MSAGLRASDDAPCRDAGESPRHSPCAEVARCRDTRASHASRSAEKPSPNRAMLKQFLNRAIVRLIRCDYPHSPLLDHMKPLELVIFDCDGVFVDSELLSVRDDIECFGRARDRS